MTAAAAGVTTSDDGTAVVTLTATTGNTQASEVVVTLTETASSTDPQGSQVIVTATRTEHVSIVYVNPTTTVLKGSGTLQNSAAPPSRTVVPVSVSILLVLLTTIMTVMISMTPAPAL